MAQVHSDHPPAPSSPIISKHETSWNRQDNSHCVSQMLKDLPSTHLSDFFSIPLCIMLEWTLQQWSITAHFFMPLSYSLFWDLFPLFPLQHSCLTKVTTLQISPQSKPNLYFSAHLLLLYIVEVQVTLHRETA